MVGTQRNYQGLERVLRDLVFSRNRECDSEIQNNPAVIREYYISCDMGFAIFVVHDS